MSQKKQFAQFTPDDLGRQSRKSDRNNGKKVANKSHKQPDYVPPKG